MARSFAKRQATTEGVERMRAVVIAGHKPSVTATLGEYVGVQEAYAWPETDGKIDQASVEITAANAQLAYYSGSAIVESANTVELGMTLRTSTFRGATYTRSPLLYDRDCQVGDVIVITKGINTITAPITALSGQYVPPDVSVEADSGNQPAQAQELIWSRISGTANTVTISNIDISAYVGTKYDAVSATYYIRVVEGGEPTNAKLRIRNIFEGSRQITPSAWGSPTIISDRGIAVTFARSGSDVFVVGQEWRVIIRQAYTVAQLLCNQTAYNGTRPRVYTITVVEGGSSPKITYAADTGDDSGGPVLVDQTPVPIGKYGITVQFSQLPACLNDKFYVTALPGGVANYTKVVTNTPIPPEMLGAVDAKLCLVATVAVPYIRLSEPGEVNYVLTESEIQCPAGMLVFEPSWTDDNVPLPIPVHKATLTITYGIWRDHLADRVRFAGSLADIDAIAGPYSADNHLKTALYAAWANSGSRPVGYIAVADPTDVASWLYPLSVIDSSVVHDIVAVVCDERIVEALITELRQMNVGGAQLAMWFPAIGDESAYVKIQECLITIADVGGGSYRLVTLHGATTSDIVPGDEVWFNFDSDPWGREEVFDIGIVDTILNTTQLLFKESYTGPIVDPVTAKVAMPLGHDANRKIVAIRRANDDRYRDPAVRLVFGNPDQCYGVLGAWYALAAVLAGLRSANYPRYPLIEPIENVTAHPLDLSDADLRELVDNGVTCVVQASSNAVVVYDKVVTTAPSTSPQRWEVFATVLDYCHRLVRDDISGIDMYEISTADQFVGVVCGIANAVLSDLASGTKAYEKMLENFDVAATIGEDRPGGDPAISVDIRITLSELA